MKILLDMNMSPKLAAFLRDAMFDAVHWSDLGEQSAADLEIFERASEEGRVIVTHDLDFGALLASTNLTLPSVVQIRADDLSVEQLGDKLVLLFSELGPELSSGVLVTLDPVRIRVRVLPLRPQ